MSVVVEFSVPADGFALAPALSAGEDVRITLESIVPTSDDRSPTCGCPGTTPTDSSGRPGPRRRGVDRVLRSALLPPAGGFRPVTAGVAATAVGGPTAPTNEKGLAYRPEARWHVGADLDSTVIERVPRPALPSPIPPTSPGRGGRRPGDSPRSRREDPS